MEREYQLQVTENGKAFVLPTELQEELPKILLVTKAISKQHKKSVYLFTEEEWMEFEGKLRSLPSNHQQGRQLAKYFLADACEVELEDGVLRLPEILLDYLCEEGIQEEDKVYLATELAEESRYCSRLLWV